MDNPKQQIAVIRQMIMSLSLKEREALLASFVRETPKDNVPAPGCRTIDEFLHCKCGGSIACPDCASRKVVKWSIRKDGVRRYLRYQQPTRGT